MGIVYFYLQITAVVLIPKLKHNRVDILLGTDFYKLLLANAKLSGKDEEPSAKMTGLCMDVWRTFGKLLDERCFESRSIAMGNTSLSGQRGEH
jgi:hypothetical protein